MSMQQWHNDTKRRMPKYTDRHLSQCHSIHQKYHTNWHEIKLNKWFTSIVINDHVQLQDRDAR
jgi:hypothetical protein